MNLCNIVAIPWLLRGSCFVIGKGIVLFFFVIKGLYTEGNCDKFMFGHL